MSMSFFRSGRSRSRSRSLSRTYKYKHKIYEYDPGSSSGEDDLWMDRGRSRSGYRSGSGSRSAKFIANLGDNHFHHRGRSSEPVIVYGADNFGWPDYSYDRCGRHNLNSCTCNDLHGKKDKDKLTELENKLKSCEKDKEEKRIKDIESQLKKLAERRDRYKLYNVPRSLQDIDLDLAGCNSGIETVKTIQYRSGGRGSTMCGGSMSGSRSCSCSRSCSMSRSRSRSRSRSCGGHFQQQQQQQQQQQHWSGF